MGIRVKRKTFKAGGDSRAVVLPSGWIKYYGDRVNEVLVIGSDVLIIAPAGLEQLAEEIATFMDHHTTVGTNQSHIGGLG